MPPIYTLYSILYSIVYTIYLPATMSLSKPLAQLKPVSSLLHGTELTDKLLLPLQDLERSPFCPTLCKKCSPPPKGPEYPMWLSSLLRNQKCKRDKLRSRSWFRRWSPVSCFVPLPLLWITLWIKQSADDRIVLTNFHLFELLATGNSTTFWNQSYSCK